MPAAEVQPASFEELAVPLFDQLYNFAHWLTRDRSEAEDLVQETYIKALRGFSSFQLGNELSSVDVPDFAQHLFDFADWAEGNYDSATGTGGGQP
jgi:hypothetical protein